MNHNRDPYLKKAQFASSMNEKEDALKKLARCGAR